MHLLTNLQGALVTRFMFEDSSLCFINCHLAAGQTHTAHRNNDVATILEAESLPTERDPDIRTSLYVGGGDGTQILDHEICIMNGDLNYRIDAIPRNTVVDMLYLSGVVESRGILLSPKSDPLASLSPSSLEITQHNTLWMAARPQPTIPIVTVSDGDLCARCDNTVHSLANDIMPVFDNKGKFSHFYSAVQYPDTWLHCGTWPGFEGQDEEGEHLQSARYLAKSALSCLLCSLIFALEASSWRKHWECSNRAEVPQEELDICFKQLTEEKIRLMLVPGGGTTWFPAPNSWNRSRTRDSLGCLTILRNRRKSLSILTICAHHGESCLETSSHSANFICRQPCIKHRYKSKTPPKS